MKSSPSPFLDLIPPEIRLLIYAYLFDDGGSPTLSICNGADKRYPKTPARTRTRYYTLEKTFRRGCYETTYGLRTKRTTTGHDDGAGGGRDDDSDEDVFLCAPLMRVCRTLHEETSWLVYGRHAFDFGSDIEAVEPFLSDLTPASRALVCSLSLYKRGPVYLYESDRAEWRSLCRFLGERAAVRRLRLVVQGGAPSGPWEGPREFSADDFRFLADIRHESLDWVAELEKVGGIEELEVRADVCFCPPPSTTNMIIFAAFSASIEKGLAEFLRTRLRLC
ncbi:hypothetical protein F4778DRAFT_787554 [Xylariomycetidae sp. FL2044]|nr:hypothetical protein F4778DRAFT_787554 [Xylariomycetidae sp. FL2044]